MAQQNGAAHEQPALLKSGFARQTRKYIQLMDELRACGTSVDIDVPTIAILGNQSSGKSSVIEAISGIALPRASGTCTRCPTEVRLIRKDCTWRCKISLRFEKDAQGVAKSKVEERPFGEDILDPSHVTERLRRAQLAILLANDDFAQVLDVKLDELPKPSASFSENTVCITIYGPDCVDLSFIDLPGIIVYAGDGENETDITVVERMARNAVSRGNCIILLTITCTDDIQNQSGATLAREVDPQGNRTIGVLTKTDLIPFGQKQRVMYSIQNIREAKLQSTGFELPGNLPYHVKTHIIKEALEHWPHLAQQCFSITKSRLDAVIRILLDKYFAAHVEGGLQAKAHQIATELQGECEAEFQQHLGQLLRPELSFVYTNRNKDFTEAKDKLFRQLLSMRPGNVSYDKLSEQRRPILREAAQTLGKLGEFEGIKAESLIKALPTDEFEQELLICAKVLAYFRTAAKRVIDNVPMAIIVHYVQAVGGRLQDTLLKRLEVYGENAVARCSALLAKDPDIIEKRAELQAQKQRLTEGLAAVRNFGVA